MNRRWFIGSVVAVVLGGLTAGGIGVYRHLRWKRFAVVEAGSLYRSGELREEQLADAIVRLKLKTVVCLEPKLAERERAVCAQQGIAFYSFAMPSNGLATPEDLAAALRLLQDPAQRPVLVHCQAGVARTGAVMALYRVYHDGWTLEQAIAELKSFERRGRVESSLRTHLAQVLNQPTPR